MDAGIQADAQNNIDLDTHKHTHISKLSNNCKGVEGAHKGSNVAPGKMPSVLLVV